MNALKEASPFLAPRRLLAINPNTNPTVTRRVRRILQILAPPGVTIDVESPPNGPGAVETAEEKGLATRHVLDLISSRMDQGYDGYILACFDDIAVTEARALTGVPVVSLAEAAIRYANATGGPFMVLTTFDGAVQTIKSLCSSYGVDTRVTVRAT